MAIARDQHAETALLEETPLLDYSHPRIHRLVESRGWDDTGSDDRARAIYEYVRDEVPFGYNREEVIPASQVLSEGYGQCNTKGALLMALLRRCGVPCRFHAFTIDKRLQAGLMPDSLLKRLPESIIHSWVEACLDDEWHNLEGFIIDTALLSAIQSRFPSWQGSFCGYGLACDDLPHPPISWTGNDTYIQHRAINGDLGVYDSPDAFYTDHPSNVSGLKGLLWRTSYHRPTNRNVDKIRSGQFPETPQKHSMACPQNG
jgi:Transglutaminase-like superfamily